MSDPQKDARTATETPQPNPAPAKTPPATTPPTLAEVFNRPRYYPIEGVSSGGVSWLAFFGIKPVKAREWKRTLRELAASMSMEQISKTEAEMRLSDRGPARALVSAHFLEIIGLAGNPSTEQQAKWLERQPQVLWDIWKDGLMGVQPIPTTQAPLDILADVDDEVEVPLTRRLFRPEGRGDVLEFRTTYRFGPETPNTRSRFDHAVKATVSTRRSKSWAEEDLDVLEGLFDELAVSARVEWGDLVVDGALDRLAKAAVPFGDKYVAVKEYFTATKN